MTYVHTDSAEQIHSVTCADTFASVCEPRLFVYKMTGVQFVKKSTERRAHEAFQRSNGPRGMSGADLQVFAQLHLKIS